MRNLLAALSIGTFAAVALTSPLWADDRVVMLGDLHIEGPMLRATPPAAPVAGGFLTIHNTGTTDDTLIAVSIAADVAAKAELHEMVMDEGVMRMSEAAGGIPVPAGEVVQLAPGGLHLMLLGLEAPLLAGESHSVTLTFEAAGDVALDMPVMTLEEIRAAIEASKGKHGDHDPAHHDVHHGN